MEEIAYGQRTPFYTHKYQECLDNDDIIQAKKWLKNFEYADPNPNLLVIHPKIRSGKRVIASFDSCREPLDDEIVIVYGNYPDWHHAYPYSSKMYRHVTFFWMTEHDVVEYHSCWEKLDTIYIINLEKRHDRYIETLLQLVKVRAPLHRIYHHKIVNMGEDGTINCARNQIFVLNHFKESNNTFSLILEDDFTFIDDIQHIWESFSNFFERSYKFDICLLSNSKYHERTEYDDLLSVSKQTCSCASGYIVSKSTIENVLSISKEGFEQLQKNPHMGYEYAFDQYWRRLDRRFYFKKKLGFQRITLSNIGHTTNMNLD
jgi:hypothetical protein